MSALNNQSLANLTARSIRALRDGNFDDAVTLSQKIIDHQDDNAGAHAIQFSSLFKSKQFEKARRMGTRAAELNPTSVFILNNQACLQLDAKQPAATVGLLNTLIKQFGERPQWLYNLALAQRLAGNLTRAIDQFQRTLDHQPDHDRAAFQLADCLQEIGDRESAVRAYDYIRLLRSQHPPTHSNFIHHSVVNNQLTKQDLIHELSLWHERFTPKEKCRTFDYSNASPNLNIGFLIGEIPSQWLISMIAPLINELAMGDDIISVYWHDETAPTRVFDKRVNVVLSTSFSDADFAQQVRADKIDSMIDVCGMRSGSRQRALGLQLANKQFGWLAHEGLYATPLVKILDGNMNDQRFYISPRTDAVKAVPINTFIGTNCQNGLSNEVIHNWAYILHQLPNWTIHLNAQAENVVDRIKQRFLSLGVLADRLTFGPETGSVKGSIVLDNFVENDPVAASHALEDGGILVAIKGGLFPAQQSAALLSQAGKENWICRSKLEYVARAISLANGDLSATPLNKAQFELSRIRKLTDVYGSL